MSDDNVIHLPAPPDHRHPSQQGDVQMLRRLIAALDDQREQLAAEGDYEGLIGGASTLEPLVHDLSTLLRSTKQDAGRLITESKEWGRRKPRVEVDGVGVVEVDSGSSWRAWQSRDLLTRIALTFIVEQGYVDDETGAVLDAGALEAVQGFCNVLADCLSLTGSTSWKVTGLRDRGVDPTEWAEHVQGTPTARIPKKKEQQR